MTAVARWVYGWAACGLQQRQLKRLQISKQQEAAGQEAGARALHACKQLATGVPYALGPEHWKHCRV